MRITKDSSLEEVLREFPHTDDIFKRHGLYCVDCIKMGVDCVVGEDTIEKRAEWYGIRTEALVAELNAAILPQEV